MKHLNQFITEYIVKKKLDKPIDSEDHCIYFPKTKQELIDNIQELLKKGKTDLNCIDTSKITDMSYLFKNAKNINFDVSNWDVSNVEDMTCMCYNCKKLNFDLSKWDISKVKYMTVMFYNCNNLKNIPDWFWKLNK